MYMPVLADRDLLDLILRAARPDEDSLRRLRLILSRVSTAWRIAARQARFDEVWLRPYAVCAEGFVRTLPALEAMGDMPALLAGMDAFQSCAATQEAAVGALHRLLCGSNFWVMRTGMRTLGGFAQLVASMQAHLCHDSPYKAGRHRSRMAAQACFDVLKRVIVDNGVAYSGLAMEAADAGVFETVVRVVQKNMAFPAMVCSGLDVLHAGGRHAGAAGMHVAMAAVLKYSGTRTADATVWCASVRVLAVLQIAAQSSNADMLACVKTVSPLHPAFVAAGGVKLVLAAMRRREPPCFKRSHAPPPGAAAPPCARCAFAIAQMRQQALLVLVQSAAQLSADTTRSIVDGDGVALVVRRMRKTGVSSDRDMTTQALGCLALVFLARLDRTVPQRILTECGGLPVFKRALEALQKNGTHDASTRRAGAYMLPEFLELLQRRALADT